jgi:hypothetical protein
LAGLLAIGCCIIVVVVVRVVVVWLVGWELFLHIHTLTHDNQ